MSLIITITISSNAIGVLAANGKWTVGCNQTPVIWGSQKSTQPNSLITELIIITIATTTHPKMNWGISKMENFFYFRHCLYQRYLTKMYLLSLEIVMAMINWEQDFLSSNSVCYHTSDWQIGFSLSSHPILLITGTVWLQMELLHLVLLLL